MLGIHRQIFRQKPQLYHSRRSHVDVRVEPSVFAEMSNRVLEFFLILTSGSLALQLQVARRNYKELEEKTAARELLLKEEIHDIQEQLAGNRTVSTGLCDDKEETLIVY